MKSDCPIFVYYYIKHLTHRLEGLFGLFIREETDEVCVEEIQYIHRSAFQ